MTGKILKVEIADIADMLKVKEKNNQSMVLFLGARAGDLFHSSSFYNLMKEYSTHNFNPLSRQEQFAECYAILHSGRFDENEIDAILKISLQNTVTTEASICLSELVKQGLFDIIISTSVDTFLEDALKAIEMKEMYDFDVFIPGRNSLQDMMYADKKLVTRLVKVFGDLPSRVYNVIKRDFYLDFIQGMKSSLESVLARDVLIVGFDSVWDEEMLHAFPSHGKTLWLVSEEEISAKHLFVAKAKQARKIKGIAGKIGSYEQFLKSLHWHLSEGRMPTYYQVMRTTLNELTLMRNGIGQIGKIHDDIQAMDRKISYLQDKMSHCSEHNGGDSI